MIATADEFIVPVPAEEKEEKPKAPVYQTAGRTARTIGYGFGRFVLGVPLGAAIGLGKGIADAVTSAVSDVKGEVKSQAKESQEEIQEP